MLAFVKMFKIKSFKITLLFFLIIIALDVGIAIVLHEIEKQSYDLLMLQNFNCPVVI